MIKFFQKIRQQLLSENKFSKYLIYAFGEIILVVIGILIALQINTWNQNKINHKKEIQYLTNLKNDLQQDTSLMRKFVFDRFEKKMEGLDLLKNYNQGTYEIQDTTLFLPKIAYGAVYAQGVRFISSSTFDELVSTGNLQLIQNEVLKISIAKYYNRIKSNIELLDGYQSGYLKLMNSLKPYDASDPNFISIKDQKIMLENLVTEEVLKITNLEITHGKRVKNSLVNIHQQALELIKTIQKEINQ